MTSRSAERTADELISLLRSELSAVAAYDVAIRRVQGAPPADDLRRLRDQHVAAANVLRRFVAVHERPAVAAAGPWGAFAKAVEGGAALLGNATAVRALRAGEEHGTAAYERFLHDPDLEPEVRRAVAHSLLPAQRRHVAVLERVLGLL